MKKKILLFFTVLFIMISIQIVTFADMDAPQIKPYTYTVSNPNGVTYYSYDWEKQLLEEVGTLEKDKQIEIIYEERINGEDYGTFFEGEIYTTPSYLVKVSNIKSAKLPDVKPQKDRELEATVLAEEGLAVYNGPAYGYQEENTIPKNTKITLYKDKEVNTPWYYVEHNDISGWICILDGAVGFELGYDFPYVREWKGITYDELKVYKDTTYSEVVGKIPANTKLENVLDIDDWSFGLFVKYNNISGYIKHEEYAVNMPWREEETFEYTVSYPAKLYKEGNLKSEVLVEEIPIGTKVNVTYGANTKMTTWIYTNYNGIDGWIFVVDELICDGETYQDVLDSQLKDYERVEELEKENEVKNDILIEEEKGYYISGTQIVLICVGVAIVIALTSFVTIILVNKKNKIKDKE